MGSVIGLVDATGNIQSRIVYDGFGNVESGDDGSSLGGDLRFQGQWLEGESGLYYMRARDYDAQTGLFLSRDAVDMQQQGVEAFNPYQFAFNNPLVYSDPTGMFTINELQIREVISDILDKLAAQAYNQVQSRAIDKARGIAGEVVSQALQTLIPTELSYTLDIFNAVKDGKDAGGILEKMVMDNAVCPIITNLGFREWLWREPAIKTNGKPLSNGYLCGDPAIATSKFPKGTSSKEASKPDFVISRYEPTKTTNTYLSPVKSFLNGDFKIRVKTAYGYIKDNKTQWQSMSKNALNYQFTPLSMYITFFDSKDPTTIPEMKKKALEQKIILYVLPLTGIKF